MHPIPAKSYYGPSQQGPQSARGTPCGGRNLFHLTPYANASLAPLYDTRKGGGHLWRPVKAEVQLVVDRYRWRVGLDGRLQTLLQHYKYVCCVYV